MIQLVYLVHREEISSVFSSQVLAPLEEHRDVAQVSLGLLTPIGHLLRRKYRPALKVIESRCQDSGIALGWIPSPPTRVPWLWSDAFLLRRWFSRRFGRDQPFIVRCRNSTTTCFALKALRGFTGARIVYDCRNAEILEMVQRLGLEHTPRHEWSPQSRLAIDQVPDRERRAITETAGVTCISHAMVQMFRRRYPEIPHEKYRVVPCCPQVEAFVQASSQRDESRQELSLQDKFVVSYLGSLAWYQVPEQSLRVFRLIRSLIPNSHFLAITTEPDKMRALAQKAGLMPQEVTILSVPPLDVPRWLAVSDLGLSFRKTDETDRVSSPVKVGEYLAAGIPVVISPRQGDYSSDVHEKNLGLVIDLIADDAQLTSLLKTFLQMSGDELQHMKERCQGYAETELSWKNVIPRLAAWYRELLDQPRPTSMDEHQPPHEVSP